MDLLETHVLKLARANAIMETALHAVLSVTDSKSVDINVIRSICAQALESARHAIKDEHD